MSNLTALHFHWCVADAAKQCIESSIEQPNGWAMPDSPSITKVQSIIFKTSLWYALLYVVVEGYENLKIKNPAGDSILTQGSHRSSLRIFRNSIFHYQKALFGPKQHQFLNEPESFQWATELHAALRVVVNQLIEK